MGDVVQFDRGRTEQGERPLDVGARLGRKLKMIRPDLRLELEQALEGFVDHLLAKQAAGLSRRQ